MRFIPPTPWFSGWVAILHQFADRGIDLLQTERGLRATFQIAAHEAVFLHSHVERGGAGFLDGSRSVFLR
jgi:hypothetical protein